jgi:endonuclease/exonuclease/phosphatase family metal-dependent hydrolase
MPDAQRSDRDAMVARTAVWREIVAGGRRWRVGGHVVLGDLNTGRHRLDEAGATFSCTAMLGRSRRWGTSTRGGRCTGWAPAGELAEPRRAGFRLDHALVSAPLAGAIRGAEYGQIALKNRLSDHAPLVVELADAA